MSVSRLKLSAQKRKGAESFSVLETADDFEDEETIFRIPVPKRAKQDRSSSRPSKPRGRPKKSKVQADNQSADERKHKSKVCNDEVTVSEVSDAGCTTDKGSEDGIEILHQFDIAKEHDIELEEDLKELEQSLSSPSEKLCLCCKLVVPTDIFTSHFKDCIQKFKHDTKSGTGHPDSETPGGSGQDQIEDIFQCPICLEVTDEKVTQEHIDRCSAECGMTPEQVLQALSLYRKQIKERRSLGLPTHPTKLQRKVTVPPAQLDKPKRKSKNGGTSDPELQMAIALSSSLAQEEDQKRFVIEEQLVEMGLSDIVEEDRKTQLLLSYSKVEKGKGTSRRKGAQATRKGKVLALYSPRKRQHIISEKVATILAVTEECTLNTNDRRGKRQRLKSKALSRFHDEHSSLWEVSNQTAEEELESYFVPDLQDYIKPKQLVVGRLFKRLSQIPGRLNTTKMAMCSDSESEDQDNEEKDEAGLESSEGDTYCTQLALAELLSSQSKFEMTVAEKFDSFQMTEGEELQDKDYESMEPASGFWVEHDKDNAQKEVEEADVSSKPESTKCEGSKFSGNERDFTVVLNTSHACTEEVETGDPDQNSPRKETDDIEMIDISDSPVKDRSERNVTHATTLSQESQSANKEIEVKNSQAPGETLESLFLVHNDRTCLKVSHGGPLATDVENVKLQHDVLSSKDLSLCKQKDTDSSLEEDVGREIESCHLSKKISENDLHACKEDQVDKKASEKGSDKTGLKISHDILLSRDIENFEVQQDTDSSLKNDVSKENVSCHLSNEMLENDLHEWKGEDQVDKKECEKGSDKTNVYGVKNLGQGSKINDNTHIDEPEKENIMNDFGRWNGVLSDDKVSIDDYHGNDFNQTLPFEGRNNKDQKDGSVCDVQVKCEKNCTRSSLLKGDISEWDNNSAQREAMRTETCNSVSQRVISVKIPDPDLPGLKSLNMKFVKSWATLLASGKCSDVRIITQSDEIQAHFLVLFVRCSLLYEEAHKNQGSVNWKECSYEGALEFLSFLYTGQCFLTSKEDLCWMDLFDLALKYKCQDLVEYLQKLYMDSPKKDKCHTSPKINLDGEHNYESYECSSLKLKEKRRSIDDSHSSLETVVFDAIKVKSPSHKSLDKRMPDLLRSSSRACSSISNIDSGGTHSPDLFDENMPVDDNVSFISTPRKSPIRSDVSFISTPRKSPLTYPLMASPKSNLSPKSLSERSACISFVKSPIRRLQRRTKGCYDMSGTDEPSLQESWERNTAQKNSNKDQHMIQKCVSIHGTNADKVGEVEDVITHTKATKKAVMPGTGYSKPEPSLCAKENQQKIIDVDGSDETSKELRTPEKISDECEVLSVIKKQKFAEMGLKYGLRSPGSQDGRESMEGNHLPIIKSQNGSCAAEPHSPRLIDKEMPVNTPAERVDSPRVSECNKNMNQSYISDVWDDYENLGYDADLVCIPSPEKTLINNEDKSEKDSCDEIKELEPSSNLNSSKSAQVSPNVSEPVYQKFQKSKIEHHETDSCALDESSSHYRSKKVRTESSCYSNKICFDDSSDSDLTDDVNCGLKVCGRPCSNETLIQIAKEFNDYDCWTSNMDLSLEEANKVVSCTSKVTDVEIVSPNSKSKDAAPKDMRKNDHTSVVETNEASETPLVKMKTKKVDITPLPNYKEMLSPELKKELSKYGIRPISKRKAVLLLNHIYEKTHPLVTDSEPDTSYNETPKKAADKTDRIGQSKKNVKKVTTSSKTKKGSNNSKKLKSQNQVKEQVYCTSRSGGNELNSSQTSSTGSEDSEFECAEETMLAVCSEQDFISPTQKDDVQSCITNFLENNAELHSKILMYEPIWIEELHAGLKENGIKCNMRTILDYLDEKCITFRTKQNKTRTRRNSKRKGKKQAS